MGNVVLPLLNEEVIYLIGSGSAQIPNGLSSVALQLKVTLLKMWWASEHQNVCCFLQ